MLQWSILLAAVALAAGSVGRAFGQVTTCTFVINELDSVQTGGNTRQFVELLNIGPLPENLNQDSLVFFDGDATGNAAYLTIPLSGTLATGGYYVVGNPGVPNVNQTFDAGELQTGVDSVILFRGSPTPTIPVTTDLLNFRDGIVYGQNALPDLDLLAATGDIPFQYNENFGATLGGPDAGGASLSRVNGLDALPFEIGRPTPGAANDLVFPGVSAIVPVPEPASLALFGLAAAGAGRRRQRR